MGVITITPIDDRSCTLHFISLICHPSSLAYDVLSLCLEKSSTDRFPVIERFFNTGIAILSWIRPPGIPALDWLPWCCTFPASDLKSSIGKAPISHIQRLPNQKKKKKIILLPDNFLSKALSNEKLPRSSHAQS